MGTAKRTQVDEFVTRVLCECLGRNLGWNCQCGKQGQGDKSLLVRNTHSGFSSRTGTIKLPLWCLGERAPSASVGRDLSL
jgi:hypothetical protein